MSSWQLPWEKPVCGWRSFTHGSWTCHLPPMPSSSSSFASSSWSPSSSCYSSPLTILIEIWDSERGMWLTFSPHLKAQNQTSQNQSVYPWIYLFNCNCCPWTMIMDMKVSLFLVFYLVYCMLCGSSGSGGAGGESHLSYDCHDWHNTNLGLSSNSCPYPTGQHEDLGECFHIYKHFAFSS